MRYEITTTIAPEKDLRKETAKFSLHHEGQLTPITLDVNGASLLKVSTAIPDLAQDFLCIASCIYAADKAVERKSQDDKWTRSLAIEIPVEHVTAWSAASEQLSECVGFLTGDAWKITFRHGEERLIQRRPRTRRVRPHRPEGQAVCLFSGGLDSFIGAVDWLANNPNDKLLLVGHYDRHVTGPAADQDALYDILRQRYGNRIKLAQTQVGLSSGGIDTNFRSRSLLFLALGSYFAEILGASCPILIPENGPIALNFPLTPSRRGSCSTRTVHPHFVGAINEVLRGVGITNPIINPYELLTKGQMVDQCCAQDILTNAFMTTRSCAKAGRRTHWVNRTARGCGLCIPCLFRRASLHHSGRDTEVYGNRVEDISSLEKMPADLLALISFLRRQPSDMEIASGLLSNGQLPIDKLPLYVSLVKRMRDEVLTWLRAIGTPYIRNEVQAC